MQAPMVEMALCQGRYRLQQVIANGGFGTLYLAEDTVLHQRCAMKELRLHQASDAHQVRLEAEALIHCSHPNIVRGYWYFEEQGHHYLVMDYLPGRDLDEEVEQRQKTGAALPALDEILNWIIPISDALTFLHEQPMPLIHRDVKPANIRLDQSGRAVLIDFGLSKRYRRGRHTLYGAQAYSAGYSPPEQYQANGTTDPRSDIYALGATLYTLVTGEAPHEAVARTKGGILGTADARLALLPGLERIVRRAMELEPGKRYQTTAALRQDLVALRAPGLMLTRAPAVHKLPPLPAKAAAQKQQQAKDGCPFCGYVNLPGTLFCDNCGASCLAGTAIAAIPGSPVAQPQPGQAGLPQHLELARAEKWALLIASLLLYESGVAFCLLFLLPTGPAWAQLLAWLAIAVPVACCWFWGHALVQRPITRRGRRGHLRRWLMVAGLTALNGLVLLFGVALLLSGVLSLSGRLLTEQVLVGSVGVCGLAAIRQIRG